MANDSNFRIIRIAGDYPVGGKPTFGLQPVFYYLSREQARLGHQVHVIARRRKSDPASEEIEGVQIHRVTDPFNANGFFELRRILKDTSPSIVHTHATSGLFLAAAKKMIGTKFVAQVHGTSHSHYMPIRLDSVSTKVNYSPIKMTYYYLREKTLWSSADQIATVSNVIKDDLVTFYNIAPDRIHVVYNGIDPELFKPIPDPELPEAIKKFQGKNIILFVGHFGLRKGLPYLIQAMPQVIKEIPDAVLVCIGGVPKWLGGADYWSHLRRLINQNQLEERVVLLDKIPNSSLPLYYSLAKVFVLPTYYEALGKVIIEAMACGLPVITTNRGGTGEVVEVGKTGLLVNYGSSKELSDAIIQILQDSAIARRMGLSGQERVQDNFTWNSVARSLEAIYRSVLNGTGS